MTSERKNVGQAMSRPRNPERPRLAATEIEAGAGPIRRDVGGPPAYDAAKKTFAAAAPGMLGNPWVQSWTSGKVEAAAMSGVPSRATSVDVGAAPTSAAAAKTGKPAPGGRKSTKATKARKATR